MNTERSAQTSANLVNGSANYEQLDTCSEGGSQWHVKWGHASARSTVTYPNAIPDVGRIGCPPTQAVAHSTREGENANVVPRTAPHRDPKEGPPAEQAYIGEG